MGIARPHVEQLVGDVCACPDAHANVITTDSVACVASVKTGATVLRARRPLLQPPSPQSSAVDSLASSLGDGARRNNRVLNAGTGGIKFEGQKRRKRLVSLYS